MLSISLFTGNLFAQDGKYGDTEEDSVRCIENLSVYKDFLREKKYGQALNYWRVAFNTCPKSSLRMYVDGEKILEERIRENETNEQRVNEILDTLLLLYDRRIEFFGNEGYVLGKKGADMYKYRYPSLEEAYNTLKRSVELDGNEAQAAAVIYYFQAAVKLFDEGSKTPEFWVELFNQCVEICEYNISNNNDERMIKAYNIALENIMKLADPFLDCEILVDFYEKKYEQNMQDAAWLESASDLLESKDCSDDPMFFKIANQLHSLSPSAASARSMGVMSMKKQSYGNAVKFFTQAIDLTSKSENPDKAEALADLELYLAKAYYGTNNYTQARTHALKAATHRANWGEPYIFIGDLYAGSVSMCTDEIDAALKTPYWVAVDMYAKAKSVDPSLSNDASQKIAKYSQYFPEKSEGFFRSVNDGDDYTVKCWINTVTKVRFR